MRASRAVRCVDLMESSRVDGSIRQLHPFELRFAALLLVVLDSDDLLLIQS